MMEFTKIEDIIKKNRCFYLFAQGPCLPKNKKIELFSRKKIFKHKVFVVLKLSAFCFEISNFSFPGCCISLLLHLLQLVLGIQSIAQFYFTSVHVEFLEGGG